MKRLFVIFAVFAITVAADAATQIAFYTGAWYSTKAAIPADRQAGQIDFYFYDDNTVEVDIWYGGDIVATAIGTLYQASPYYWRFNFTDTDGWYYYGSVKDGFLSGKFIGGQRGKFQAN